MHCAYIHILHTLRSHAERKNERRREGGQGKGKSRRESECSCVREREGDRESEREYVKGIISSSMTMIHWLLRLLLL